MKFSLNRLRRSKAAHTLSVMALLSLVVLLHPYCESADAAETDAAYQTDGHHGAHPGDGQPLGTDLCPSLDHTPAMLPDGITLTNGDAAAKVLVARLTQPRGTVVLGAWRIFPRATPPPTLPLPIYLRYAHLLI